MQLNNIWTDGAKRRACFSWLTRIGAAPKFGTLPIAYYQQDQCKAIEALESALVYHGLPKYSQIRTKGGRFQAQEGPGAPWIEVAMLVCGQIVKLERKGEDGKIYG